VRQRSLSVPDARGPGAYLRVTRHPEQRKVVLSHWRDGLCVASTPVEVCEVPALIGVLADALGDAVEATAPSPRARRGAGRLLAGLNDWLRPRLAQVAELRSPKDRGKDTTARREAG
jgi:hypothetical protein